MPLRLKSFSLNDKGEVIKRITIAVNEVFGYASLPLDLAEKLGIDPVALAAENEWSHERKTLNHVFSLTRESSGPVFGQKPFKKPIKKAK